MINKLHRIALTLLTLVLISCSGQQLNMPPEDDKLQQEEELVRQQDDQQTDIEADLNEEFKVNTQPPATEQPSDESSEPSAEMLAEQQKKKASLTETTELNRQASSPEKSNTEKTEPRLSDRELDAERYSIETPEEDPAKGEMDSEEKSRLSRKTTPQKKTASPSSPSAQEQEQEQEQAPSSAAVNDTPDPEIKDKKRAGSTKSTEQKMAEKNKAARAEQNQTEKQTEQLSGAISSQEKQEEATELGGGLPKQLEKEDELKISGGSHTLTDEPKHQVLSDVSDEHKHESGVYYNNGSGAIHYDGPDLILGKPRKSKFRHWNMQRQIKTEDPTE